MINFFEDQITYAIISEPNINKANNNVKFFRNKVRHELLPFYSNKHYNLKDELLMIADRSLNKFNSSS